MAECTCRTIISNFRPGVGQFPIVIRDARCPKHGTLGRLLFGNEHWTKAHATFASLLRGRP